jgi:hypothetical protein
MRHLLLSALLVSPLLGAGAGCNRGDSQPSDPEPAAGHDAAPALSDEHAHDELGEAEGDPLEAELQAYAMMEPIFVTHCARCHQPGEAEADAATLRHFSMGEYPLGGHHAHEMSDTIRKVLGAGGGDPTMPEDDPGALAGEELAIVLLWADAFDRAREAGVGHHAEYSGHGHGHDHHHHDH